jgi:predicted Zn-dependent protease
MEFHLMDDLQVMEKEPYSPSTYAGDIHFDNEEIWNINIVKGQIDIQSVATHEIGHALGLAHSAVVGSVMYPLYNDAVGSRVLTTDDIAGIV